MLESPGALLLLNARSGNPLRQGPDVIRQSCRHGWGSPLPLIYFAIRNPLRPHRPTEIITVHYEVSDGLMHLHTLGETVTPANFSCVRNRPT